MDYLCGYPSDFLSNFGTEGLEVYEQTRALLKKLVGVPQEEVTKLLSQEGMSDSEVSAFASAFLSRQKDLQTYYKNNYLSNNKLETFDWNLSLVMSSSKLSEMAVPILQLELQVESSEKVLLEFTCQELEEFTSTLKKIQAKLRA